MPECTCFSSVLHVTEQLHRVESALATTPFDQILSITRQASTVLRQYASCVYCFDPSYFTLYIIVMRKSVACYGALVLSNSGSTSSPGTASTNSSSGGTSRLRVGSFEIEAPLDENTKAVILRGEIRQAAEAVAQLEGTLSPYSIKAAGGQRDDATLAYHRALLDYLKEEVSGVERQALSPT